MNVPVERLWTVHRTSIIYDQHITIKRPLCGRFTRPQVGVLLGGTEEDVRRQADDVISLETELAGITTPAEQRRDEEAIYHKMTVPQLQETAPLVSRGSRSAGS